MDSPQSAISCNSRPPTHAPLPRAPFFFPPPALQWLRFDTQLSRRRGAVLGADWRFFQRFSAPDTNYEWQQTACDLDIWTRQKNHIDLCVKRLLSFCVKVRRMRLFLFHWTKVPWKCFIVLRKDSLFVPGTQHSTDALWNMQLICEKTKKDYTDVRFLKTTKWPKSKTINITKWKSKEKETMTTFRFQHP